MTVKKTERSGGSNTSHVYSPDEQQNESVQTPLERAEPDALDPDQLVGLILTQTEDTAARHDELLLLPP